MKLYLETTMFNYYFDEDREGHADTVSSQTINPAENELDAIRIKLYEDTKDMSSADQVAYMRRKAEDGLRRHGYKLVPTGDKGAMRLVRI